MSVDTVNFALTQVRRWIQDHPDSFAEYAFDELVASCECMRSYLMQEDIDGFDRYVDRLLANNPDRADFILEELFIKLNITDREELSAKLLEA